MFNFARFESLRAERGITKSYLAKLLGRTPTIIQDWKQGKSAPNRDQLCIISNALGTTPEYLTGESDEKKPLVNNDEELTEYLEELRDNPDMRMLFSITKGATKEHIQTAVKILLALRGE